MKHFATTIRIAQQLKADKRTIALILIVPVVLLSLLYYEFHEVPASPFDRIGPTMLAILPLTMMFLITSVAMLRERTTGTLERILTTPINTINLMVSYAIVFGVLGLIQAGILCFMVLGPFNVDIAGPWPMLLVLALLDAFLGVSLGLFASALARSEFQAVQFMPVFIAPQLLLCGLFIPLEAMPNILETIARILPMTWAVEVVRTITTTDTLDTSVWRHIGGLIILIIAALYVSSLTMRRTTR